MEKTQRTFAAKLAYARIPSAILFLTLLISSFRVQSQCPMVCQNINISLDTIAGGAVTLTEDDLLTNPASCVGGVFVVEVFNSFGTSIGATVTCAQAGYTLIAKVTDSNTKNNCWAKVKIEDKAGPNIVCARDTISCLQLNAYSQGLDQFPNGQARDNCGVKSKFNVSIVCKEFDCTNTQFVALCQRKIIATDQWGLTSECTDSLWIGRDSLSNVENARDTMLNCNIADTIKKNQYGNPDPIRLTVPTINGYPVWPNYSVCKIISRYSDTNYPICGKSRKIRRQWTITDWCTREDTTVIQWIKIMDTTAPVVTQSPQLIVKSAAAHDCNAPIDIPRPKATDCSGVAAINYTIEIMTPSGPKIWTGTFSGPTARVFLPAGNHIVQLFILDSCSNTTLDTQDVIVNDQIPPTPVCDERTTTTLDPTSCWSRIYAVDLDNGSHDNCCNSLYFAVIEMDSLTKYQTILQNRFRTRYGDALYNANRAKIDLVIDRYINCRYFNEYVDLGHCGNITLVMRVYEACNIPLYDPHVTTDSRQIFYCKAAYPDQAAIDQWVIRKVIYDSMAVSATDFNLLVNAKNYNDCMVNMNVQDKQAPVCTVAPVKFAYCDGVPYEIAQGPYNNLEAYCIESNGIYDTAYLKLDKYDTGAKVNASSLFDTAKFTDNCSVPVVTFVTSGIINNCTAGTLTRTWTGTDQCGNSQLSTTCSQQLKLVHRSDFEVLFPKDIETSCLSDLTQFNNPSGDNYPKIFDDDCEQVGVSYEDVRYEIAKGACYKILRTWKLIDWCAYDPGLHKRSKDFIVDTAAFYHADSDPVGQRYCTYRFLKDNGDGYITYTQVIKVSNSIAPTISLRDSLVLCASDGNTCTGRVRLREAGRDDCTDSLELKWTILTDLNNDGTINNTTEVTGPTATIDGQYAVGKHKFTFIVRDLCGNESRRESIVDVKLCKKPTPYLLNGIAASLMPVDANNNGNFEGGMLVIWASDFNAGSSAGCGSTRLIFSFSSDTTKKSITFTCDSVGKKFVNVWVTDSYGNQDFARTFIEVQDNNQACSPGTQPLTVKIDGLIKTEDKLEVEKVNVTLDGNNAIASITKYDGAYAFGNMSVGGTYKVMPKKDINPMNGVSTLDLLMIQKHIQGVQSITSPYKLIAADVNKSNDVSSVDLVELRKLILGIYENFQGNESWRFVPNTHKFKNVNNPFEGGFPEYYNIDALNTNVHADFVGIKVGDVNGTVTPNQLLGAEARSLDKELILMANDVAFKSNELIKVPVMAESFESVQGYQFTISFDRNKLVLVKAEPVKAGMSEANFGLQKVNQGLITTSYVTTQATTSTDKTLFNLYFRAREQGQLSQSVFVNSKITSAEAYTDKHEVMGVQLKVGTTSTTATVQLLQNSPNPFNTTTVVGFILDKASAATFTVFDVNGRALKMIHGNYQKGYNSINLSKQDFKSSGVYYYQLATDGFKATRKMIIVE